MGLRSSGLSPCFIEWENVKLQWPDSFSQIALSLLESKAKLSSIESQLMGPGDIAQLVEHLPSIDKALG